MSRPILYHTLFSTCSQKVRFALAFKGIAYDSRVIDLAKSEHLDEAYLAINPNGVVPTLIDRGYPVVDSSVICEYLDEAYWKEPLSPADPIERAAMRSWMRYFEEVPTPAIRAPSFNALFARSIAERGEEANRALRERMPLRGPFYAKLGPTGFSPDVIAESYDKLASCLRRVAGSLEGKTFLLGNMPTIADICLLPTIVRMQDIGLSGMWSGHAIIDNWFLHMQEFPAFATTYVTGSRPVPVVQ